MHSTHVGGRCCYDYDDGCCCCHFSICRYFRDSRFYTHLPSPTVRMYHLRDAAQVQMFFASFSMCQQTDTREEHRFGGMRTSPPFSVITINLRAHRTPVIIHVRRTSYSVHCRLDTECISQWHARLVIMAHIKHAKKTEKYMYFVRQEAPVLPRNAVGVIIIIGKSKSNKMLSYSH